MGVMKVDNRELKRLRDRLTELEEGKKKDEFCEDCARELAARLIRLVKNRTGVVTGELRRGWTAGKEIAPEIYVKGVAVYKSGETYTITVENNVEYALYYEYGHRQEQGRFVPAIGKRLVKSYVEPKYALKYSEQDLESIAPGVLYQKLETFLREVFDG